MTNVGVLAIHLPNSVDVVVLLPYLYYLYLYCPCRLQSNQAPPPSCVRTLPQPKKKQGIVIYNNFSLCVAGDM